MARINLMYHGIHEDATAAGRFDPVYSVRTADFIEQMDWIAAQPDPTAFHITFDDGDCSNASVALPIMQERSLRGTFFITSGFVDCSGMLTKDGVRALHAAGMRIGAHGATHRFLADLSDAELDRELRESKSSLESITGDEVTCMALPGGRGNSRELEQARRIGFIDCYGSVPGRDTERPDEWRPRVAITRNMPLARFMALATWSGFPAHWMQARFHLLVIPKRLLGNAAYQKLRARWL